MEILNKKAKFDYFIEDTFECGIVLKGTEIKSIRSGKANLKDSYGIIKNNELVFDASKEVNLNEALGEISSDKVVVSNDISSIREFGQDAPVVNNTPQVVSNSSDEMINNDVKILSRKRAGFANKKFFVVIAILFFVSACVFMGYEAFRYFQAVK